MANHTFDRFEWGSNTNESNRQKHGIAFEDAVEIFDGPYVMFGSDRSGETRWLAIGETQGRVIAVVYTERKEGIRIISARMARTYEREKYKALVGDIS